MPQPSRQARGFSLAKNHYLRDLLLSLTLIIANCALACSLLIPGTAFGLIPVSWRKMQTYRHRQTGTLLLILLGSAAVLTTIALFRTPQRSLVILLVLAVLLLSMGLFWALTVEVTADQVLVWFGPGLIHRRFRLDAIRNVRRVRNPWYYGWGVRLTPNGWLFNVSGFDAVELELENNRNFRIGTDDPQQLLAAIQQVSGRIQGP